jgi:hypothetical protein
VSDASRKESDTRGPAPGAREKRARISVVAESVEGLSSVRHLMDTPEKDCDVRASPIQRRPRRGSNDGLARSGNTLASEVERVGQSAERLTPDEGARVDAGCDEVVDGTIKALERVAGGVRVSIGLLDIGRRWVGRAW